MNALELEKIYQEIYHNIWILKKFNLNILNRYMKNNSKSNNSFHNNQKIEKEGSLGKKIDVKEESIRNSQESKKREKKQHKILSLGRLNPDLSNNYLNKHSKKKSISKRIKN